MNTHTYTSDPELIILRGINKGPKEIRNILFEAFRNILFDLKIDIKSKGKDKIEVILSGWYESDVNEIKGFEAMQEKFNDVIGTEIENN